MEKREVNMDITINKTLQRRTGHRKHPEGKSTPKVIRLSSQKIMQEFQNIEDQEKMLQVSRGRGMNLVAQGESSFEILNITGKVNWSEILTIPTGNVIRLRTPSLAN